MTTKEFTSKEVLYTECDRSVASIYETPNRTKQRHQLSPDTLLYLADIADDKTHTEEDLIREMARCYYKRKSEASQLMNHIGSINRKDAMRKRLLAKLKAKKA